MKNTNKTHTRQETNQQKAYISGLSYISSLSKSKLKLLNRALWCFRNWAKVTPSQGWLAKKEGLSRRHVIRALWEFEKNGLIGIESRKATYNTNIYTLSEFFNDPRVMQILRGILPAIFYFSVVLLTSKMNAEKNVTPYSIILSNYITGSLGYGCIGNGSLRACARGDQKPTTKPPKNKRMMMDFEQKPIPGLPTTNYGLAKLAAFEQVDLDYAINKILKPGKPLTKYTYIEFWKAAKGYCEAQGRKGNYTRMFKALTAAGYDGIDDSLPSLREEALKVSYSKSASTPKESPQQERPSFTSFLQCHSTCRDLKIGQRCAQTTQMTGHYRSTANLDPEGYMVSDDSNIQMAALRVIENYKTEYGKRALKIFGWANPWFDKCTNNEQEQLIAAYPWITEHIGKRADNPMLQNLSQKMTESWNKQPEPGTFKQTFADGQPLYQTEEEPDDIYYTGGSDGLSQATYIP